MSLPRGTLGKASAERDLGEGQCSSEAKKVPRAKPKALSRIPKTCNPTHHQQRPCPSSGTPPTHSRCGARNRGAAAFASSSRGSPRPHSPRGRRHVSSPPAADWGSARLLSGFRTCRPATRRCRPDLAPVGEGLGGGVRGRGGEEELRQGQGLSHSAYTCGHVLDTPSSHFVH